MKLSFTFSELVEIFNRWSLKETDVNGYELACEFLKCWCTTQKQEHFAEMNRRYRGPEETK
jgi:hypothetical protein